MSNSFVVGKECLILKLAIFRFGTCFALTRGILLAAFEASHRHHQYYHREHHGSIAAKSSSILLGISAGGRRRSSSTSKLNIFDLFFICNRKADTPR